MAARYLNAIFCEPDTIRAWYKKGAKSEELPNSGYFPEFDWDTSRINGKQISLYPLNVTSIVALYQQLAEKTPREFLLRVVRDQLSAYADGQLYSKDWKFPDTAFLNNVVPMRSELHSYNIDQLNNLSLNDKKRLKALLIFWGNGTAGTVKEGDKLYIGGLPYGIFKDIGLGAFNGVSSTAVAVSGGKDTSPPQSGQDKTQDTNTEEQRRQRDHKNKIDDVENWYQNDKPLKYSSDIRRYLRDFIKHTINWQAEGVPEYLAESFINNNNFIYIQNQTQQTDKSKASIIIEKNADSKVILNALCEYEYADSWEFRDAAFFQIILVSWLEKNKEKIKKAACGYSLTAEEYPLLKWSMALEFLRLGVLGQLKGGELSRENIIANIFQDNFDNTNRHEERTNKSWLDVITLVKNNNVAYTNNKKLLTNLPNTYMGIVGEAGGNIRVYRGEEILRFVSDLEAKKWDIQQELPQNADNSLLMLPINRLKELYPRVEIMITKEKELIQKQIDKLSKIFGGDISEEAIIDMANVIDNLFLKFNACNIPYKTELKIKCDKIKTDAKSINVVYSQLKSTLNNSSLIDLLCLYSLNPGQELNSFLETLNDVEQLANAQINDAEIKLKSIQGGGKSINIEAVAQNLKGLYEKIDHMKVEEQC